MALTIQQKAEALRLFVALSPENISRDGEATRAQIAASRKTIMARLDVLNRAAGYTISESEAFGWADQVDAHAKAERTKVLATMPQHPLLQTGNVGVWTRKGKSGQTAYYIWGPQHCGTDYRLFSEFSYDMGSKEQVGAYATLNEAVEAGEAFLATVTYASFLAARPQYRPENLKRALQRLPEGFDPKIPPMPAVTGFTLRVGDGIIAENISADEIGAIVTKVLVERGEHVIVTSI